MDQNTREQLKHVRGRSLDPVVGEGEHFDICPTCAQALDMRSLYQVFHHEGHKPLSEAELAELTRVVWREGGRSSIQTYEPLARETRPQAPHRLVSDLRYQPLEHGGKCPDMFPLGFRIFDSKGRTAVYLPVEEPDEMEKRPQDADGNGTELPI